MPLATSSTDNELPSSENSTAAARRKQKKGNQYVGAATAGTRALVSQFFTMYLRVPVKLFRPTRVDYLLVPRAINPAVAGSLPWRLHTHSSFALLAHAIREHGWSFIPNQVLPPLVANSLVGIVLYTSYLTALPLFSEKMVSINSIFGAAPDVLSWRQAFMAGLVAGGAQSLAAAPIDAVFTGFTVSDLKIPAEGIAVQTQQHKSLWRYSREKLRAMGMRGVFRGYTLSLVKESLGFGAFFATFEGVKHWSYDQIVMQYGAPVPKFVDFMRTQDTPAQHTTIREQPSAALYPATILGAGAVAAVALQVVQQPVARLQAVFAAMAVDYDEAYRTGKSSAVVRAYADSYGRLLREAAQLKRASKRSWMGWLYAGFGRQALSAVPSSSVGLFVFEIMRVRYMESEVGEGRVLAE
ncbi:mitochondrial carrier domain-containing protein [Limtongia smithiae]|uniref:mitochondrial carrier domain-containing protein n=1 Tax=Limtongia smithiae TaxID=1125753 RepID=UPI0034CD888E